MDGLKLKYDTANDSWVWDPIQVSKHRISSAETFGSSSEASARKSYSSVSPYQSHFSSGDAEKTSRDNGRFWRSVKRYCYCLNPQTNSTHYDHHHHHGTRTTRKEKNKIKCCGGDTTPARTSTMSNSSCYSSMTSEERDEHIKAVIHYCKSTSN